ncbi:uncharacterized protein LOC117142513 [Drosophila mauritiana]|uniref:Uncharacterized protein LOC117142513 n=1 Tax=Drosophila mauritiana TaxID=7226 RepID=A0A6P8JZI9_DROMA|nr:uncharacterized protein LOC117142513 [Drosophila mauritiana]
MKSIGPITFQVYHKRMVNVLLLTLSRMLVVSSFLADAMYICQNWRLEQSILNINYGCGRIAAGVCISLMAIGQFVGSALIVTRKMIYVGTGLLWLAGYLRMALNPTQRNLAKYFQVCNVISALMLIVLRSRRTAVVAFLLLTILNWKDMERHLWIVFYKFGGKLMAYQKNSTVGLTGLQHGDLQTLDDPSLASKESFWHKVSVAGGFIFIVVNGHLHIMF